MKVINDGVTIGQLNNYSSVDQAILFEVEGTAGNKNLSLLQLRQLLFADLVGEYVYFSHNSYADNYLPCEGQELDKLEYALLYSKIGDTYNTTTDLTKFNIPDLREFRFLSHKGNVGNLGQKNTDTMRKILGDINYFSYRPTDNQTNGSFGIITPNTNNGSVDSGNNFGTVITRFDSAKGIEGQLGQVSPNVGSETAPKNTIAIICIRAKA